MWLIEGAWWLNIKNLACWPDLRRDFRDLLLDAPRSAWSHRFPE